jgi:hypothetical protein
VQLKYTLVTDGSSDKALLPILDWLCGVHFQLAIEGQWFDPRPFAPPTLSLQASIARSLDLFPCDILFVHRDAENISYQERHTEITSAVQSLNNYHIKTPYICVVPVRMTEAWLLFDERAIRRAAGNPNGRMRLHLPSIREADRVQDPKATLFQAFRDASGLNARRRRKLNLSACRYRVAELTTDFSPLRILDAFSHLENDIIHVQRKMEAIDAGVLK